MDATMGWPTRAGTSRTTGSGREISQLERLMVQKIRRVVTGHDAQGRSAILFDGAAPCVKQMDSMPGLALTDLWESLDAPADNSGSSDAVDRPVRLAPPVRGSLFRIVEFPPDSAWKGKVDADAAFRSIGAASARDHDSSDPLRHKTATIDYIVVIKGEIYAIVDTGEVLLKPGDVFIQRGTMHSWSVRGNEPCLIAVVLIGSNPV